MIQIQRILRHRNMLIIFIETNSMHSLQSIQRGGASVSINSKWFFGMFCLAALLRFLRDETW